MTDTDPPPPPVARPPKRLFRLGPVVDPLALDGDPDGPGDDPAGERALHLFSTRRGALLAAFAAAPTATPDPIPGSAVVPVRLDDPRPFLDLRDPAALPPDLAALLVSGDGPARARLLTAAADLGLAGAADALPDAPAQTRWAVLDPGAVRPLAPARPLSPHDPDLVAVRRLLATGPG